MKKENKTIKGRIIRDNTNLFEQKEDYYKPVRVGNFWSNIYREHESNGNWNKTVSIEYLNTIRPYLRIS